MDDVANKIPLLIIAGPTAVGKTQLSLEVADTLGAEIVSCDSAQVYRGLDIGSAKVSQADRARVRHHLIDVASADEPFSVADFHREASVAIRDIWQRGHLPVVVGGTGLWIRSLIRGFELPDQTGHTVERDRLAAILQSSGIESLRRQLRVVDADSFHKIAAQDQRRTLRALEVFRMTGRRLARASVQSPYRYAYWVLTRPTRELHDRIEERVVAMTASGLLDEVEAVLASGVSSRSQSLTAIGYREMVAWLQGWVTGEERDRLMVRHTRQYAKRQLTWFRAEKEARWLDLSAWSLHQAREALVASGRELLNEQKLGPQS